MNHNRPILSVRDLSVNFVGPAGRAAAVDGVSFELLPHETLALVGESGCGKTITTLSILGLLPKSIEKKINGKIIYKKENLLNYSEIYVKLLDIQENQN